MLTTKMLSGLLVVLCVAGSCSAQHEGTVWNELDTMSYTEPGEYVCWKGFIIETPAGPSEIKAVQHLALGIYAKTVNGFYIFLKDNPNRPRMVEYEPLVIDTVVIAVGLDATVLYSHVKASLASLYKHPGSGLQFEDTAAMHVISNISLPPYVGDSLAADQWSVECRMDVQVKDGRYLVQLDHVNWFDENSGLPYTSTVYREAAKGKRRFVDAQYQGQLRIQKMVNDFIKATTSGIK